MLTNIPTSVLETEAALHIGKWVRDAGYGLEVAPRSKGVDLAASRDGTVWATFHLDLDLREEEAIRVGATVWGGARSPAPAPVARSQMPDPILGAFVRERLRLACKRGRAENPDHCSACPDPSHAI